MSQQHEYTQQVQDKPFPKITSPNHRYQQYDEEYKKGYELLVYWLWPMASWFLILTNGVIGVIVVQNMWNSGFNLVHQLSFMLNCIMTLAAIAAIHKYLLKENKNV